MVPDLCKSPGRFIGCCLDSSFNFFFSHVWPDMAKIIQLFPCVRFSFPPIVSNWQGLTSQQLFHHFIKTFFNQVITMLGDTVHRIRSGQRKTFYLDDIAGVNGCVHMVAGDAIFLFPVIYGKIGTAGSRIFGAAGVKINGGDGGVIEQRGWVNPG